ncbi:chemotaxis protein CheY [Campylobacter mucosalis]|uniref:Two-component system response regulator n=1 Tax=Campylobacter mucosalis CCUG 21559 TaxID=1032067 RepID=A0A6G5QFY7_9BACT|nr:response regulator transcription factor [Campylobacter mucosalis]KEA45647.1 chemotaxis protein CheY [Campylobacter mucosalis]QCD44552.1 two-component system response regulator [Campylobacter mucosalis CCUG 21559]QKF62518.1 two-component system response regulator [Campylobacter mucosalis]
MINSLKNLTILIVEDENDTRELMQEVLKDEFSKVITAQNGDEGLKKFKKYNPDIVLTDIAMPIMDGLDMTGAIKQISRDVPIIALSAHSEKEKLLKAIDVGINKYLMKPIDVDELLSMLESVAKDRLEIANVVKISDEYSFSKTRKVLIKNDEPIPLTKKELAFISLLVENLGNVVLHEDIKNIVWIGENVSEAAIRTFVKRMRDKAGGDLVKNVPGLGYKIEANFK